jgi:hypothetical protein
MESNEPTFPIHRWPYKPCWELDGFDFSVTPVALYKGARAVHALHSREFTTGIPKTQRPSEADYSRMTSNNLAVQFQAMLFCKDYYPSWDFWKRANECGLRYGTQGVKNIETLFVQARKAYLQSTGGCPNDAARFVDEWIAFRDSTSVAAGYPVEESTTPPWGVRFKQWSARMKRGDFINCGQSTSPQASTTTNFLLRDVAMAQSVEGQSASRDSLNNMPVKREGGADDSSAVDLAASPGKPASKRKRRHSRTSESRPPKRHAPNFQQTEMTDDELQFLEPFSSLAQERQPGLQTPGVLAERESSPAVEQHQSLATPRNVAADLRSTKARVTKFEDKLAEHLNLIHAHDFRLAAQEELVADHATKLNGLESSPATNGGITAIQKSIDELMDRQNNRSTYIRTEVKKRWNDVRSPLEQAQNRADSRLDTIRDELAVLKARIEDCQKAVNHNNQERDISELETSLKTKVRTQRKRVDELFARISELENGDDGNVSLAPNNGVMNKKELSQVDKRVSELTRRIANLEKKQEVQTKNEQSAIAKIFCRLDALEVSSSQRANAVEADRTDRRRQATEPFARFPRQENAADTSRTEIPERRVAEQETRLFRHATEQETRFARYERVEEPARTEIANVRGQMWNSSHQIAPGPVPVRASYTHERPTHHLAPQQETQRQASQGSHRAAMRGK